MTPLDKHKEAGRNPLRLQSLAMQLLMEVAPDQCDDEALVSAIKFIATLEAATEARVRRECAEIAGGGYPDNEPGEYACGRLDAKDLILASGDTTDAE